ncbi:hypothetical protein HanIR_Chr17g0888291 [Helianthus annuus]|nr:hypothetical protein HanIR_Chr17g0888291 [Helianthus annuus]
MTMTMIMHNPHLHFCILTTSHHLGRCRSNLIRCRRTLKQKCSHGGHHRHQPGHRKLRPPMSLQTRRIQSIKRLWKYMNKPCGQDHAGCECFHHKEPVFFGS